MVSEDDAPVLNRSDRPHQPELAGSSDHTSVLVPERASLDHAPTHQIVAFEAALDPTWCGTAANVHGQLHGRDPAETTEPRVERRREGVGEEGQRQNRGRGPIGEADPSIERCSIRRSRCGTARIESDLESRRDRDFDAFLQRARPDTPLGRSDVRCDDVEVERGSSRCAAEVPERSDREDPLRPFLVERCGCRRQRASRADRPARDLAGACRGSGPEEVSGDAERIVEAREGPQRPEQRRQGIPSVGGPTDAPVGFHPTRPPGIVRGDRRLVLEGAHLHSMVVF